MNKTKVENVVSNSRGAIIVRGNIHKKNEYRGSEHEIIPSAMS